jgi:peptide/nickel transport system substrate-binding protein
MVKRRWSRSLVGLLAVALVLGVAGPVSAAKKPKYDESPNATLRYGHSVISGTPTWDPAAALSNADTSSILAFVYDRLLNVDLRNELMPMLATSWKVSDDGLTVTLKLRSDVKFEDGGTFDATNAAANLKRNAEGVGGGRVLLANMASATAVDPTTLAVTLKAPDGGFLYNLATNASYMVSPKGLASPAALTRTPAGSGPYKLVSTDVTGQQFERVPNHWDKTRHVPTKLFDQFLGSNRDTIMNALIAGQIDFAFFRGTQVQQIRDLVAQGKLQGLESFGSTYALILNSNLPPFDNPQVRKALTTAIDREGINQAVMAGACSVNSSPNLPTSDATVKKLKYKFNPEKAKKELAKLGVAGTKITFLQSLTDPNDVMTVALAAQLTDVGFDVTIVPFNASQARAEWFKGAHNVALLNLNEPTPDAAVLVDDYYFGRYNIGLKDAELQSLLAKARVHPLGSRARLAAMQDMGRYIFKNPLHIPICASINMQAASLKVGDLAAMPMANVNTIGDMTYLTLRTDNQGKKKVFE